MLVITIFSGLPDEYDTLSILVNSWLEPYIAKEIESLLPAQEGRKEKHTRDLDTVSINLATHKKHYRGGSNRARNYSHSSSQFQPNQNKANTQVCKVDVLTQEDTKTRRISIVEEGIVGNTNNNSLP